MKDALSSRLQAVTLRQLRALAAVIEAGSISAAAARTAVTPPAVSLQLRQLEGLIGAPLIERITEGYQPTAAGRELLDAIARIELALGDCGGAIDMLRDAEAGRVTLGVISTAKYFAPQAVAAFKREHPRIEIHLRVGNREEMLSGLERYEFDIAITGRPPETFEVDMDVLGDHPHVIVAPPTSPLAGRDALRLADLQDQPFLLREEGSGTRLLVQDLFRRAGLSPATGMEIGSNETIKQAVIAGLGIALISGHTIAHEVREGRLAVLEVEGLPVVRQWFVVKRREKRLLPAARTLRDFLVRSGREHLPRL